MKCTCFLSLVNYVIRDIVTASLLMNVFRSCFLNILPNAPSLLPAFTGMFPFVVELSRDLYSEMEELNGLIGLRENIAVLRQCKHTYLELYPDI